MMGLMLGASSLYAQPGSVQKLAKSVFTLTTFNQKGDIIASTQGVFIDNKGTAISTFKPFVGAVKASVVDASGKSIPVEAIMGADELYDVAIPHQRLYSCCPYCNQGIGCWRQGLAGSIFYQEAGLPAGGHQQRREVQDYVQLLHLLE